MRELQLISYNLFATACYCHPSCRSMLIRALASHARNSAWGSLPTLVFKTVLERFPLTRLLSWLIPIKDTFLQVDGLPPRTMNLVMAVAVQCLQMVLLLLGIVVNMMHFEKVVW